MRKKRILSIIITVVMFICMMPISVSADPVVYPGFGTDSFIAPAKLNSNGTVTWYKSSSAIQNLTVDANGNINVDLGKLKNLVPPSNSNGWTGFLIELEVQDQYCTVNTPYSKRYTNKMYTGMYVPYGTVFNATLDNGSKTCTINLTLNGNNSYRPSGSTATF